MLLSYGIDSYKYMWSAQKPPTTTLSMHLSAPFTPFFLMSAEEILYETEHPKIFLYKIHMETTEEATEH